MSDPNAILVYNTEKLNDSIGRVKATDAAVLGPMIDRGEVDLNACVVVALEDSRSHYKSSHDGFKIRITVYGG